MSGNIIKEFLVGLGFEVDSSSLDKFNKALANAAVKVTALYVGIQALAAGVFKSMSDISKDFEQIGYDLRIIAPAINRTIILRREMLKSYAAAGINIYKATQDAVKFNLAIDKTKIALKAIAISVAAKFWPLLTKQLDTFRKNIYANMPKIEATLEKFIKVIFKAFEATVILGNRIWSILGRVWDFFVKLDKATDGWSTIVLAVVAAWKLLNLAFLASPLGLILTGLLGILALYDDFKTFEEGGKSLFDWTPFLPVIKSVTELLSDLWEVVKGLFTTIGYLGQAFVKLFHGDYSGFFDSLEAFFSSLTDSVGDLIKAIADLFNVSGSIGHFFSGLFGDKPADAGNVAKNIQNNPIGTGAPQPLGASVSNNNNQNNQHVNQQTNINVMGTADAGSVGKAVAGEQSRVNFDMTRNLKGAITN